MSRSVSLIVFLLVFISTLSHAQRLEPPTYDLTGYWQVVGYVLCDATSEPFVGNNAAIYDETAEEQVEFILEDPMEEIVQIGNDLYGGPLIGFEGEMSGDTISAVYSYRNRELGSSSITYWDGAAITPNMIAIAQEIVLSANATTVFVLCHYHMIRVTEDGDYACQ